MTKVHIISEGSLQAKEFFTISLLICCSVRQGQEILLVASC